MTGGPHYTITQNGFTSLKFLCAPPAHPSSPQPQTLGKRWLFYRLHGFAFRRGRAVGILPSAAFADWLLRLSDRHLGIPPCLFMADDSFFFLSLIFCCLDTPWFIDPFAYRRAAWPLLSFGHYE